MTDGHRNLLGIFCVAVLAFGAFSPADAQTVLIGSWNRGDWIVPAAGGKALYGASATDADFAIAQWGNLSELSAFAAAKCPPQRANCFIASSPNISDSLYTDVRGNRWVDLVSRGTGKPCYPALNHELDNFQSAISLVYRKYPQAVLASAKLGEISRLYLSVTAEPVAFSTLAGAQCAVTAAGMIAAVVFNNRVAHQTLFYQLRLQSYRNSAGPGFFANAQPFGFRDMIREFGVFPDGLPTGAPTPVTIDLLPRLKTILSTATNGLDTNVRNWTTGSAYVGQGVFGNVRAESAWCCFSLVAR